MVSVFQFRPTQRSSLPSQSCPSRWCPQVVVVGRSLAAVVDVGGGRSVVVASRENPIPNLILFSFSFSTHSHFPSLSLVFVAVVPRGGGRRSFFGGGGRRWYRPFGGGRADASFARAAPVPSHFPFRSR